MSKKRNKIKIKKSKINLYSKRKNKTKQTISLIVTIFAACILCVVGYGIGKPIYNYFANRDNPPDTSSSDFTSTDESSSSEPTSSVPEPEPPKKSGSYLLPTEAAETIEALNSALAAASEAGYAEAVVTLKDESGALCYKSEIARIKAYPNINAGALSAKQICEAIEKAGLTPVARISTLKDVSTPTVFGSYTHEDGTLWLDNSAANGGKLWLSPFEDSTVDYISELVGELSAAGFKEIICTNVMFPAFHGMDKDTFLVRLDLRNKDKRCEALWNVVDKAKTAAESNGAKLRIEMSGANLVNPEKGSLDSEIGNNPEKLKTVSIVAVYTPSADVSLISEDAKAFAEQIKAVANGAELSVMINGDIKGAALAGAQKAFEEAGLPVILGG